jgi:hypothetical protein
MIEIAIALESVADTDGGERKKEGDIIAVRPTGIGIGAKEASRYLWFRIDGLVTRAEYEQLASLLFEPDDPESGVRYDKRRYCVPLARLEIIDPSFDIGRARDTEDIYQPYMMVDPETLEYLTVDPPFDVSGLVYDKVVGDYI